MFNFGFDPEQFASLGSSFDEPDPFAPTPVAPAPKNLPVAPEIVKAPVSSVTPKQERVIAKGPVAPIAPNPTAVAPVPNVFSPNFGASFTAEAAQAEKDSPTTYQGGFGAYAKPDTEQKDYSGRTNLGEFHDTAYAAMLNNEDGYDPNPPNAFTGDLNLGAYRGTYIDPIVNELKEGGYTAFQKQEEGAITKEQVAQGILKIQNAYGKRNPLTQSFLDNPTFDATRLYMNTNGLDEFSTAMSNEPSRVWQDRRMKGKYVDISGGTSKFGDYSMVWVEDPKGPSGFSEFLSNPVVNIAANFVPGGTLALTAAKAANGQTLHGMDYASAALSGFELSKTLQAPATAADAAKIGEAAGKVASESGKSFAQVMEITGEAAEKAKAGKGFTILGESLSYNASKGLINAVAVGDPKAAILGTFGGKLVKEGLDGVGLTASVIEGKGIGYNDFTAGLTKVVEEVGNGRDMDEALAMGLGKYIREGGTLGAGTADTLTGVVRDVVRPIGKAATELYRLLPKNFPKGVDTSKLEEVLSEANRLARQGASAADTLARKGLREFDKKIQPVTKPAGRLLSAADTATREVLSEADTLARQGLSAFDDAVIQPTGEFLSAADTAARKELTKLDEGLYDIQSPFSTPEIDLPSIDLPNFNLPSLGMGMGMLLSGSPAPTATTGKIFENELFKFKNKIELTEFGPLNREQEVDIEDFLTSPFESAFTTSQRFA